MLKISHKMHLKSEEKGRISTGGRDFGVVANKIIIFLFRLLRMNFQNAKMIKFVMY